MRTLASTRALDAGGSAGVRPPLGRLMQICFVVPDLEQALAPFSATFGAGPWFTSAPASPLADGAAPARYRGQPAPIGADIALAYSGDMMYELACPLPEVHSIWSERVRTHGYGLHHLGFGVTDFDATVRALRLAGRNEVMTATTPRGTRVVMVGGGGPLGVLEEYIELTEGSLAFYAQMKAQADAWDGEQLRATVAPAAARPATAAGRVHVDAPPELTPPRTGHPHG